MADDAPARKINALQILGGVLILWQSVLRPLIGSLGDVDTVCNVLQLSHDKCGSGTMIRAVIAGDWWQPVLILVGIALILWGERRRNDALRLATMLPIVSEKEPETDQPPVQPGSGDTLQVTGTVSDPAPGPVLERLLHTCYVLASPQKMKTHGFIELTVVAYNASVKTLILADVLGNARCTMNDEEGKQLKEKLPTPDLMRLAPNRRIAPFTEFVMVLNQAVSPRQAELILATQRRKR